jgi:hypothetical protein
VFWDVLLRPTSPTATQTLGEEYTDIWQYSASSRLTPPSPRARAGLILIPTLSAYVLGRWGHTPSFNERYPSIGRLLKALPVGLEVLAEVNLAIFYLKGTYYGIVKRFLGIQHVRSLQYIVSLPSYRVSYLQSQKIRILDRPPMLYLEFSLLSGSCIVYSSLSEVTIPSLDW